MAIDIGTAKNIASATETGRRALDAFNPTRLGVGASTPAATGAALTAVDATAINATYDAVEEAVLNNVRTRLNEIEARLQAMGIIL